MKVFGKVSPNTKQSNRKRIESKKKKKKTDEKGRVRAGT